jgi:hypothetical protein
MFLCRLAPLTRMTNPTLSGKQFIKMMTIFADGELTVSLRHRLFLILCVAVRHSVAHACSDGGRREEIETKRNEETTINTLKFCVAKKKSFFRLISLIVATAGGVADDADRDQCERDRNETLAREVGRRVTLRATNTNIFVHRKRNNTHVYC